MLAAAYYRPSLMVPRRGKLSVLAAVLAVIPVACLYAWATSQPTPGLNLFCVCCIACCLALLANCVAAFGNIRHPAWMGRAGAGIGFLAWYIQWAAWIAMNDRLLPASFAGEYVFDTVVRLCIRPDLMFGAGADIIRESSSVLARAFFILFWLVEFIAHLLPPLATGARRARAPFCEETRTWAKVVHVPDHFSFIKEPDLVKRRLEDEPQDFLSTLGPPIDESAPRFAQLTFYHCHGAHSFLTITNYVEMAGEEIPIPEVRTLSESVLDKVQCYAQVDDPVVELLRVPVRDPDLLVKQWHQDADQYESAATADKLDT